MLLYHWNAIGHERELASLEMDLAADNVAAAYLFTGPQGIGKFTIAKTFAGILQCERRLCRTCATCVQVAKGSHLDTMELHPDGDTVRIDAVRAIGHFLSQKTIGKRKIVLVRRADLFTTEAANALLKNLEEPPARTTFFLTASSPHELPETVLSRCRIVAFHLPPQNVLVSHLAQQFPDLLREELSSIATMALGRPGRAMTLLRDPDRLHTMRDLFQRLERLMTGGSHRPLFRLIEEAHQTPWFPLAFLESALALLRGRLFAVSPPSNAPARTADAIQRVMYAIELLRTNVSARMLLENIVLHLSSLCPSTSGLPSRS